MSVEPLVEPMGLTLRRMRGMWQLSSTRLRHHVWPFFSFTLPSPVQTLAQRLSPRVTRHDSHAHSFAGPGVYGHPLVRALLFVFPNPILLLTTRFPSPLTCLP